jgi:hypothetical protein
MCGGVVIKKAMDNEDVCKKPSPSCDGWVPGPARENTGGKLTPACFVQIC